MLRDFPITGNEGATKAEGYQSLSSGMFVRKGHGLKELDAVAPSKDSSSSAHILHIDSIREDVDYIQFDGFLSYFSDTVAFISRGQTSELAESNEFAFRAMHGEKVARPWPYPSGQELSSLDDNKRPIAFIRTEFLQVVKDNNSFLYKDRYQVYKGHGFLPGDEIYAETVGRGNQIVDIIPGDAYDEIVLNSVKIGMNSTDILFDRREDDSSLSPDILAKRNAYISKLQAS